MLLRVLIWTVFIYFMARLAWRVLDSFMEGVRGASSHPSRSSPQAPKRTVEYKDVEDAKFVDVPASPKEHPAEDRDSK